MNCALKPHELSAGAALLQPQTRRFAFLLLDGFSAFDLASATEALWSANQCDNQERYVWLSLNETGETMRAASGLNVAVDGPLQELERNDTLIVLGGRDMKSTGSMAVLRWLRREARRGVTIGAVGAAVYALSRAGLLEERVISTHWALQSAVTESCPELEVDRSIFSLDRGRITCAGGTATLDLMLHLINNDHGAETATWVADRLLCASPRGADHEQCISEFGRTGIRHEKLARAMRMMRDELEFPLPPSLIATEIGISTRQLERLFSRYLGVSPKAYYIRLRLENARSLLQHSNLKVIEVALANGFSSQSHFSKVYRRRFGVSPHEERAFDSSN